MGRMDKYYKRKVYQIELNADICTQCGICTELCPVGIFVRDRKTKEVEVHSMLWTMCIGCGHCATACPTGAVELNGRSCSDLPTIPREMITRIEQFESLAVTRRSIRAYRKDRVPRRWLTQMVDIAAYAPTAKNLQLVEWIIVENPETVQKLSGLAVDVLGKTKGGGLLRRAFRKGEDPIHRGAPHLIIAHCPDDYRWADSDAAIALTHVDLAAHAIQLGTCWAGYFTDAAALSAEKEEYPIHDLLELPHDRRICGALMIGYPRFKYPRQPERHGPIYKVIE